MLRKRSIFLFVVLIVLMGVTLVLTSIEEQNQSFFEDDTIFAIENIDDVDRVVLTGPEIHNELVKDNGIWRIQKFEADPDMTKVLLQALHEVRVKRAVPSNYSRRISHELENKGILVTIYKGREKLGSFMAGGDFEKRETYFSKNDGSNPLIVYIPGYDSYISGIFELKETDWRNRVIFNSNWTSLKNVKVSYPNEPANNFEITFKDSFFHIPDMDHMDTAKMMSYIELFNYVEAENYITTEKFPDLDSILNTSPIVKIELVDMNKKKNNELQIFKPLNPDQTILGVVGNGQMAVLKYPKVQNLIKKRSDFQRK